MVKIEKFVSGLIKSDPQPEIMETVILSSTFIVYVAYIICIFHKKNSGFISWGTIIVTIIGSGIFLIKELYESKRWWFIIQSILLFTMIAYIFNHKLSVQT